MNHEQINKEVCGVRNAADFALKLTMLCELSVPKIDVRVLRSNLIAIRNHFQTFRQQSNLIVSANLLYALHELTNTRAELLRVLETESDDGKTMRIAQIQCLAESLRVLHERFLLNGHTPESSN